MAAYVSFDNYNKTTGIPSDLKAEPITAKSTTVCPNCGATIKSHRVCKECGYYKNTQVVKNENEEEEVR